MSEKIFKRKRLKYIFISALLSVGFFIVVSLFGAFISDLRNLPLRAADVDEQMSQRNVEAFANIYGLRVYVANDGHGYMAYFYGRGFVANRFRLWWVSEANGGANYLPTRRGEVLVRVMGTNVRYEIYRLNPLFIFGSNAYPGLLTMIFSSVAGTIAFYRSFFKKRLDMY